MFFSKSSKQKSPSSNNIFSSFSQNSSKIIDFIWPIKAHEVSRFILISLIMFGILGIQNLIRALKDGIVNTMIGTETISFLKFWGVMPASFLITLIYIRLVGVLKGESIFFFVIGFFLIFFTIFAFYIFPNFQVLHLDNEKVGQLILTYPHFKWFIMLLSNWSFSLFYIIAELWPNAVFALLFWQFVNKITEVEQSKRFYPLFGIFSQTGLLFSGIFLQKVPTINNYIISKFNISISDSELSIKVILSVAVLLGVVSLFCFWLLNNKVLERKKLETIEFEVRKKEMGLCESFKMILQSRYILLITTLLMCYGLSINLVEGPWKSSVSKVYTTPTEFTTFVGSYLTYTGIFTITFVILGSNIVRRLGWYVAAIITPLMVLSTGLIFFIVLSYEKFAFMIAGIFLINDPTLIAISIGAIQNILSKSSKYALFDSTKEMTYVPLDDALKTKGKAAADMIGTKLGKSTSALIQSLIFILIPSATFSSITNYLMVIFVLVCIVWIWAIKELNGHYKIAVQNKLDTKIK